MNATRCNARTEHHASVKRQCSSSPSSCVLDRTAIGDRLLFPERIATYPHISTMTLVSRWSSESALSKLRVAVEDVITANPILTGVLRYDQSGLEVIDLMTHSLITPDAECSWDSQDDFLTRVRLPKNIEESVEHWCNMLPDMPLDKKIHFVNTELGPLFPRLRNSIEAANDRSPLLQVEVLEFGSHIDGSADFYGCIRVTIPHGLADAHTYYSILQQLEHAIAKHTSNGPKEVDTQPAALMWGKTSQLGYGIWDCIDAEESFTSDQLRKVHMERWSNISGEKMEPSVTDVFLVDMQKIRERKVSMLQEDTAMHHTYLSSNDVLMAALAEQASKQNMQDMFMFVKNRRVSEEDRNIAGNAIDTIQFPMESATDPNNIRKKLIAIHSQSTNVKQCGNTMAPIDYISGAETIATDWTKYTFGYFSSLGDLECHIPYREGLSLCQSPKHTMIRVFCPTPHTVGILYKAPISRRLTKATIKAGSILSNILIL